MRVLVLSVMLLGVAVAARAADHAEQVKLETTKGTIVIQLEPASAPKTVANFLAYVRSGFYDGTVFHRVVPGFVIQGGGFTAKLDRKPAGEPIVNEAKVDARNLRGTVAMARTADVNSATSQFFINLADNAFLDHKAESAQGYGYCVFGRVIEGMDVVDAIAAVPTGPAGPFPKDVPVQPVVITHASIVAPR